jgi:hypothetical protein
MGRNSSLERDTFITSLYAEGYFIAKQRCSRDRVRGLSYILFFETIVSQYDRLLKAKRSSHCFNWTPTP